MSENTENAIVTLVDENDESFDAELIDSILYDGHTYCMFVPVDEKDNDEAQVIVMEYKEDGDDTLLLPVENDVLLDEIWDAYSEEINEDGEE